MDNRGWRQGGGAWFTILGNGYISNNTFYQNSTIDLAVGMGGALALSAGNYQVTNNTFAENYAWFHGGGIQAGSAEVTLTNNLFFQNESAREWACYQMNRAADADGGGNLQYPPYRYNQSGSVSDCLVTPTVIVDDPELQPLGNNGGPTQTMALLETSSAVGAGSSVGAPGVDQRGYERLTPVDSGAFQYNSRPPFGLMDVIAILQICAGMIPDTAALQITDIDDDSRLGVEEAVFALQSIAGGQ